MQTMPSVDTRESEAGQGAGVPVPIGKVERAGPLSGIKARDTCYEIWWLGADGKWRLAHEYSRIDLASDQLTRWRERWPGLGLRLVKSWCVRHPLIVHYPNNPTQYPQITHYEQTEIRGCSEGPDQGGGGCRQNDRGVPGGQPPVEQGETGEGTGCTTEENSNS